MGPLDASGHSAGPSPKLLFAHAGANAPLHDYQAPMHSQLGFVDAPESPVQPEAKLNHNPVDDIDLDRTPSSIKQICKKYSLKSLTSSVEDIQEASVNTHSTTPASHSMKDWVNPQHQVTRQFKLLPNEQPAIKVTAKMQTSIAGHQLSQIPPGQRQTHPLQKHQQSELPNTAGRNHIHPLPYFIAQKMEPEPSQQLGTSPRIKQQYQDSKSSTAASSKRTVHHQLLFQQQGGAKIQSSSSKKSHNCIQS
ncbi:hypothetical protein Nepgr_007996 [Nepenthes gracilis]|uniref:Uncharacterized protein n=1 Tax=Nepenthes gracilis TaxID=150966 RepID=A0AAD3S8T0_NEPGR|nr:hypothetical protein Nepgr_007996 [Nepenthes gracilis]